MNEIIELLMSHRLRFGTELQLQDDVEAVLSSARILFDREKRLGGDPIDFLTLHGIGIECKVAGSPSAVLEQLVRYAQSPQVQSLILVTSRHTHRFSCEEIGGKPFRVVWISGNL